VLRRNILRISLYNCDRFLAIQNINQLASTKRLVLMINDLALLAWHKSSFSEAGSCVEVAFQEETDSVYVRDSKNPDADVLSFTSSAWMEFIEKLRTGQI